MRMPYSSCTRFCASRLLTLACIVIFSLSLQSANADQKQRIVVFGASGKIGGLVVAEALERGHQVVGISRNPDKLSVEDENFSVKRGDVTDIASFRSVIQDADAIAISVVGNGGGNRPEHSTHAIAARTAIAVLASMKNAPYVIQVGGASTMIGDKEAILAAPLLPAEEGSPMYGVVFGHLVALDAYRDSDIDWTIIAPPQYIDGWSPDGNTNANRTGKYRTSTTELVRDADGRSAINVADIAVAVVDEIESRHFNGQRFTVGY